MSVRSSLRTAFLGVALAIGIVSPGAAQTETSIGLMGGAAQYDLSGTGTAPFAAAWLDVVPARARWLVAEAGLAFFTYEPQSGERINHWFPEVMLQVQRPSGLLGPYLGAGVGYAFGSGNAFPTLAAAGGLRIRLHEDWALRGELRIRSVDPWTGTTADWGFGFSRRF